MAAGIHLVERKDEVSLWESVEPYQDALADRLPGFQPAETAIKALSQAEYLNKKQLHRILNWKFSVGKTRAPLRKLLDSNTDAAIEKQSQLALSMARAMDTAKDGSLSEEAKAQVTAALSALTQLKGVGPATASAVLCWVRPDLFCFMYDEVIDCLHPVRDYKLSTYLAVNDACLKLGYGLGWTSHRVATCLWIASRYNALFHIDLTTTTLSSHQKSPEDKAVSKKHSKPSSSSSSGTAKRTSKRARRI